MYYVEEDCQNSFVSQVLFYVYPCLTTTRMYIKRDSSSFYIIRILAQHKPDCSSITLSSNQQWLTLIILNIIDFLNINNIELILLILNMYEMHSEIFEKILFL
jgi:hypothetical protein